jgi:hypothetical protein
MAFQQFDETLADRARRPEYADAKFFTHRNFQLLACVAKLLFVCLCVRAPPA